jgi:hypothetical protein
MRQAYTILAEKYKGKSQWEISVDGKVKLKCISNNWKVMLKCISNNWKVMLKCISNNW